MEQRHPSFFQVLRETEAIGPMGHERTARNLSVCDGTTRSSWSAVSSMVGGYWRPRRGSSPASSHGRRTLWRGEYLRQQRLVIQQ